MSLYKEGININERDNFTQCKPYFQAIKIISDLFIHRW